METHIHMSDDEVLGVPVRATIGLGDIVTKDGISKPCDSNLRTRPG